MLWSQVVSLTKAIHKNVGLELRRNIVFQPSQILERNVLEYGDESWTYYGDELSTFIWPQTHRGIHQQKSPLRLGYLIHLNYHVPHAILECMLFNIALRPVARPHCSN